MPTYNLADAVRFTRWLGQQTPAVYTLASDPPWPVYRTDGKTSLEAILAEHVNTYFSPAQTVAGLSKKARKDELVSTSFLHVDMDPVDGRDQLQELSRLYDLVADGRPGDVPPPSCVIESGRGIQCLWRLKEPQELPGALEAVESANLWLMEQLQAPPGTHNVDRILRMPGSWNALDAKKINKGYRPRQSQLIEINDSAYTLEDFGKWSAPVLTKNTSHGGSADDIDDAIVKVDDLGIYDSLRIPLRIKWLIAHGVPSSAIGEYERDFGPLNGRDPADRSAWLYDVCCQLLRRGVPRGEILGLLTDPAWRISGHCLDQKDPERAARRQLARAVSTVARDTDTDGDPFPKESTVSGGTPADSTGGSSSADDATPVPPLTFDFIRDPRTQVPLKTFGNTRLALEKLEVELRHNVFTDALTMNGVPIQDAEVMALFFQIEAEFGFILAKEKFFDLVHDEARKNPFHPVKDYLDGLKWDGVPRLDCWLVNYGGAPDSLYTRSVGALPIIAAVKRVRDPGCEFQEILTLVSAEQGTFKSSALRTLCPNPDWFTDDLPLNAESQQVIERLQGHLIVECAETKGMKKGNDEHIKAFLSRRIDKARMAYGRITQRAPRQCVFIATSNDEMLLRDPTGNRRWWPVIIKWFDVDAIARDRDQLWAEAAHREAQGESIRLAPSLYEAAGMAQAAMTQEHPFVDVLSRALSGLWGKILAADAMDLLGSGAPRAQDPSAQFRMAMLKMGWAKTRLRFNGEVQSCYTRDYDDGNGTKMDGKNGQQIVVSKRPDGRPVAAYLDSENSNDDHF